MNIDSIIRSTTRGNVNVEYINKILEDVMKAPAYELTTFNSNPEDRTLHIEATLETVFGMGEFNSETAKKIPYGEFIFLLHRALELSRDDESRGETDTERMGTDLYFFLKALVYSKDRSSLLGKLWNINYGALRLITFQKYMDMLNPEVAASKQFLMDMIECPMDETFGEYLTKLYNSTKDFWVPGQDKDSYIDRICGIYERIYGEIFLYLYWGSLKVVPFDAESYKYLLQARES